MTAVITKSFTSGAYGNKRAASCVGVAAAGTLSSAFFYASGTLSMRQNEDGSIDVKMDSFDTRQSGISNALQSDDDVMWGSNTWTFQGLWCNRSSFTIHDGPSGPSGFTGLLLSSTGHISHEGYTYEGGTGGNPSNHVCTLDSISSTGWKHLADAVTDLQYEERDGKIVATVYLGGLIAYSNTPDDDISLTSAAVSFGDFESGGIEEFFDWYPWSRRISGAWRSLNRDGGPNAQQSTGLFRRESGLWAPVSNSLVNDSNGFRRVSGEWQASQEDQEA